MSTLNPNHFLPSSSPESARKSGRAVRDDRGDAVWEWQVATGVFERDVTDEQLRRLEAPDLRIVEFSPSPAGEAIWMHSGSHAALPSVRPERPPPARKPEPRPAGLRLLWARLVGAQ